jgi:hypothetical protein
MASLKLEACIPLDNTSGLQRVGERNDVAQQPYISGGSINSSNSCRRSISSNRSIAGILHVLAVL